MTTFVAQQLTGTTTRTVHAGRAGRAPTAVRTWGQDYAAAFRASAAAPRREGMDPTALLMFGRD